MDILEPLVGALADAKRADSPPLLRLATITSTSPLRVQFDGEATASPKTYKRLGSYSPVLGHRVLAARVGRSWVILGQITA